MATRKLALLACGVLVASFPLSGEARPPATPDAAVQLVHTEVSYPARSREANAVLDWLQQNRAFDEDGAAIGRLGSLGDIRVSYTRTDSSFALPASPGSNPPVPLPASGSPGDVITIESTSGGIHQSWTYEWRLNGRGSYAWILTSYLYQILPR